MYMCRVCLRKDNVQDSTFPEKVLLLKIVMAYDDEQHHYV